MFVSKITTRYWPIIRLSQKIETYLSNLQADSKTDVSLKWCMSSYEKANIGRYSWALLCHCMHVLKGQSDNVIALQYHYSTRRKWKISSYEINLRGLFRWLGTTLTLQREESWWLQHQETSMACRLEPRGRGGPGNKSGSWKHSVGKHSRGIRSYYSPYRYPNDYHIKLLTYLFLILSKPK